VVRHLLSECDQCRRRAAERLEALGLDVGLHGEITEAEASASGVSDLLRVSNLIREELKRAKVNFARLAPLSAHERLTALRKEGRYKKYGLALHVLDEADALVLKRSFGKAEELVRFSMAVTELLRPKTYGTGLLGDLRLRQRTTFANLKRLTEDFMGALESLEEADGIRHLSIDPGEEARLLRVEAAMLYDLGEFERAARASEERAEICELVGDTHTQGKALLQAAMILAQYDPETGLQKADKGLVLVTPSDSFAVVCGIFNRAFCLIQLGRTDEAAEYLLSNREIIRKAVDPRREIHFRWLDAKIMRARRQYRDAEEVLSYVALRFREEGMNQEMLLVHLDRIELRLETGRWKSALNIARHLTPVLTKLGLRNDLLSMWASLQDALVVRQVVLSEFQDFYRRRWNSRTGLKP
jgi:tetratricopeptide (TPR) repeat protein